ncbi:hypothetical protein [Alistipes sp. ZOR0009]|uniref:hypothetical protein n=1 Tax=Alistipes sp. ZOR0009 TaxID=1339253 RepID=UPI00064797B4|nr:hypothetical protein [Alistipes sp. ZOR0009]
MLQTIAETVKINYITTPYKNIDRPLFEKPHLKITEDQLFLQVYNQAQFYVEKGEFVNIYLEEGADTDSVQLFLNGSVLGALLLQNKILALHGSSFCYNGVGVVICGNSGAGKSSVTAAFCQNRAQFITDDITPISIKEGEVYVKPLKTEIKLWDDALEQLNLPNENLRKIRPTLDKFYFPYEPSAGVNSKLHLIIILNTHNKDEFTSSELTGVSKFLALKDQIYRKLYLKGMPQTEQNLCLQLLQLGQNVRVLNITRPKVCSIHTAMDFIKQKIAELQGINEVAL